MDNVFDLSLIAAFIGGAVSLIIFAVGEYRKKNLAFFKVAVDNVYMKIEDYVRSAQKFKHIVNTLDIKLIISKNKDALDKLVTSTINNVEDKSIMLQVFFPAKKRKCFVDLNKIIINFNASLHMLFIDVDVMEEMQIMNKYDEFRKRFNDEYDSTISGIVELCYGKLFRHNVSFNFHSPCISKLLNKLRRKK